MFPSAFPNKELMAELTARMLLEVEAVRFQSEKPFLFTSGWASPVYIDCRLLISYPRVRQTLMDFAASVILRDIGFESIDAIAGGETAGIPFAAWIADRLMLPMQYVRKKPKGFGRDAQIEGTFSEGDRILLVEDLTTDGRSKVKFCEALRKAGAEVSHTFVLFYYDIFPEALVMLKEMGVKMHFLATWWDVLTQCKKHGYFDSKTLDEVEKFLKNPVSWSSEHGGTAGLSELKAQS
ncbi:MAG: orotate phosphoribosyltransferase [Desulfobacteraceae bacterium]|nr:MAG: orotate phosphoribosyltransferase [Desulfobacteraceae bacterium]